MSSGAPKVASFGRGLAQVRLLVRAEFHEHSMLSMKCSRSAYSGRADVVEDKNSASGPT